MTTNETLVRHSDQWFYCQGDAFENVQFVHQNFTPVFNVFNVKIQNLCFYQKYLVSAQIPQILVVLSRKPWCWTSGFHIKPRFFSEYLKKSHVFPKSRFRYLNIGFDLYLGFWNEFPSFRETWVFCSKPRFLNFSSYLTD